MKSSLSTIQRLHRIGKVLSRIFYILSIVTAAAAVILSLVVFLSAEVNQKVSAVLSEHTEYSITSIYGFSAVAVILSLGEAVKAGRAEDYFKTELEAGTPFKMENAKKMLHLGILVIVVPIVTYTLSRVVYSVMALSFSDMAPLKLNASGSVTLGVMFIITSLLLRYGAEKEEGKV